MAKQKPAAKNAVKENPKEEIKDEVVNQAEVPLPEPKPKKVSYVVTSSFMDRNNSNRKFNVGEDVSHFDSDRLANAEKLGLVKKVL